jgi:hypothetical protein
VCCTKERQGAPRVKGARPCEDTLERQGAYCYTLEKCVKLFVRDGKGVIGVFGHPQGLL